MLRSLLVLSFCLCITSLISAQAFIQRYEEAVGGIVVVADLTSTADGGVYALVMDSGAPGVAAAPIVIRTDAAGEILWSRTYSSGVFDDMNEIHATPDGGFIMAGVQNTTVKDGYLAKVDANGNVQWTRVLGADDAQLIYGIEVTADGGYAVIGAYDRNNSWKLYATRLDDAGNEIWSRYYDINSLNIDQLGYSAVALPNGNLVITGANGDTGDPTDAFVMEVNTFGAIMWIKTYDYDSYVNTGISIQRLTNGDLMLLQHLHFVTDSSDEGPEGFILSRLDTSGEEIWSRFTQIDDLPVNTTIFGQAFTIAGQASKLIVTPEEDIVIAITGDSNNLDEVRPQLLKLDSDGTMIWGRQFGAPGFLHAPIFPEYGDLLTLTSDNHYAIIYQSASDLDKLEVAKIDPAGEALCVESVDYELMPANLTITSVLFQTFGITTTQNGSTTVADRPFTNEASGVPFEIDLGPDTLLCPGQMLTIDPQLDPTWTYFWQDGSSQPTLEVGAAGEYSVAVSDGLCIARDTILVDDFAGSVNLGPDQTLCSGATISLMPAEVFAGDYNWDDGTIGPNLNVTQAGSYILNYTSPNCGTFADTIEVAPVPEIVLDVVEPAEVCPGETATFTATSATPNLSFSWLDGAGNVLSTTSQLAVIATQSQMYTVLTTDGCGEGTATAVLNVAVVDAVVSITSTSCGQSDGGLAITAQIGVAPFTVEWLNSAGDVIGTNVLSLTDLSPDVYTLNMTDAAGCSFQEDFIVPASNAIEIEAIVSSPTCDDPSAGNLSLNAIAGVPPFSFALNGGTPQDNGFFTNLPPGNFEVAVSDAAGCEASFNFTITELVVPEAIIVADATEFSLGDNTPLEVQTNLAAADIATILWQPAEGLSCTDCLNPIAQPTQSTVYFVTVTDVQGCSVSTEIELVVDASVAVYVPNIFSPNNDGSNDRFLIFPAKGVEAVELVEIFDRWGGLVYSSTDNQGWDGRINGDLAAPGVYIYQVQLRLLDGNLRLESGDITLIR